MNRLEFLLKKNRFAQAIYIFVFSLFYRFIGLFIKVDKKLILFNSFSGRLFNDSPRVLYEAIKSNPKYKNYKCVWAFTKPNKFKDKCECKIVKMDSFKYFVTALKAKYWVTNVNIERGLKIKRKRNICLNTWHGTGPKTGGNDVKGRKDYNFSNIDFILADGPFLKNYFVKNFHANEKNIFEIGRPREDILFEAKNNLEEKKKQLLRKFNFPSNKKYLLFAPTWRESTNFGKSYEIGINFNLKHWSDVLGEDYIILFRAHSITTSYEIPMCKNIIDVTSFEEINELYIISDILVSDYSSCFTDFSILEKPMFCFAPDYVTYKKDRGLVYDMEPYFTGGVIKEEAELLKNIKNLNIEKEKNNSRRFNKSFTTCRGNSTEKCLELLFSK